MQLINNNEEYGEIIFGVKSKFFEFILKYPFRALLTLFFVIEVVVFLSEKSIQLLLKPAVTILPLFLVISVVLYYFCRNYCYKVVINKQRKKFIFYLMFNRKVVEKSIQNVRVIIDNNCKIIINNQVIVVFVEIIHKLVPYFPASTEISFVGLWGRLKEKDWRRRNLKLEPGSMKK